MATGEFTEIIGRMGSEMKENLARQFLKKALLYLGEEDLKALEAKLSDQGIEEQVQLLKARLSSMFGSPLAPYDPLDLFPLFRKNFPLGSFHEETGPQGYLISGDKKMMLMIGKPKGSAPDTAYDELLVKKIRAAEASARKIFTQNNPSFQPLGDLSVGLTGGFIHALEDSRIIKKELLLNFSISLMGILLLMLMAFRSGVSLLYALFPLLISPLLTLGFFSPFLGHLSESAGAFSAIILGLSVDFVILLYSRYLEEKNAAMKVADALEKSLTGVGPGILTGAITTTAAYYALFISDFRGVKELGLLTGTGILVSLVCALFLLPAMVAWRETKNPHPPRLSGISSFLGLQKLSTLFLRKPLWIILFCTLATPGLMVWAFRVELNNDPQRLRPADHPSLTLEMRIQEKMEEGMETVVLLTETKKPDEALEVQGKWRQILEKGMNSGLPISRYENLAVFIPPLSHQKRVLEWIESRRKGALDPDRVKKKLRESLQKGRLNTESFEAGIKALGDMLTNREGLTWEQIETSPLKKIADRFLKKEENSFLSAAYLHVRPNFWIDTKAKDFLDNLQKSAPGTRVTSSKLVQRELEALMTDEAWKVLLLALAAVLFLIYLDFRSWRLTLLSLLPVSLASLWTLGIMGMWKIPLNFMNLVVFTMVLGIGVDYGVHILHRGQESIPENFEKDLEQVSKGVILAGLTTLVGFGSLVFSAYPGLQSMGAVTLMGVGFSLLFAMILVPGLMQKWLQKKRPF
jgi:predicted RND superfamily exporter protein